MKLTLKFVRAELALVGVTIRKTLACEIDPEYCVRLKGSKAGEGYFTNDLQDALSTGNLIAERAQKTATV